MNRSGGEGGAEPDAPDGMAGEDLAEGHKEALAGLVFGLIGWADEDVLALEGFPDWRRWIGEAPVGEGVGGEQIAEFVVDIGDGEAAFEGEGGGEEEGENKGQQNCQRALFGEPS